MVVAGESSVEHPSISSVTAEYHGKPVHVTLSAAHAMLLVQARCNHAKSCKCHYWIGRDCIVRTKERLHINLEVTGVVWNRMYTFQNKRYMAVLQHRRHRHQPVPHDCHGLHLYGTQKQNCVHACTCIFVYDVHSI